MLRKSLGLEIENFVSFFNQNSSNKLSIFTKSAFVQRIMQDFYAALFVSNIQTLMLSEIQEELEQENNTKYKYKVNTNLSYGFLKNRIIDLLRSDMDMDKVNQELKNLFKRHLIPIRPDRSNIRNTEKYRQRKKPKVTKSQRDVL